MFEYNELTHANRILNNGFGTRFFQKELNILSKYYKHQGHKPKKRKELLYDFCEKNIENYNPVIYYESVNQALNHASKKNNVLVEINEVHATDKELEYLEGLDLDYKYKKLLFTLIVLDKLHKAKYEIIRDVSSNDEYYFGKPKTKYTELKRVCNIPLHQFKKDGFDNIHIVFHYLINLGLIEPFNKGNIKLLFMYDIDRENSKNIICIKDYEHIGWYYDGYNGIEKIKECEECGILIKYKSNRTKYCKECFEDSRKKYKKEKQREYRNK